MVRWSPDNEKLIVATEGESGEPLVYLAKVNEHSFRRLDKDVLHMALCQGFLPLFSPDGRLLLYSARTGNDETPCSINVLDLNAEVSTCEPPAHVESSEP
jgi:Tol biopolymer transport system component